MPGLGDALSKAFEDSVHDLDALVDKAAKGEDDTAESDAVEAPPPEAGEEQQPAAPAPAEEQPAPEPEPEPSPAGVGRGEKTELWAPEDLPDKGESLAEPPPPPAEDEVEPAAEEEPPSSEESLPEPGPSEEVPPPPSAEDEAPPSEPEPEPEAPPAAEEEAPPGPSAAELTSPTMTEPVAPFAQFAASGVIRRRLRKRDSGPESEPEALAEEPFYVKPPPPAEPAAEIVEAIAPSGEVVLSICRSLPALENVTDYRIPLLVEGVSGIVRLVDGGGAGDPAVLAVAGAGPRSGTTTVAAATALKLAEKEERRVLLVDADFRSPGLARLLGQSGSGPDFGAVLGGEATLADAVLYARKENLAVLPIYRDTKRPSGGLAGMVRVLRSGVLPSFLAACREQFDAVLLDTGGLTGWPGSALVAGAAGSAILVVRSGRVNARDAAGLKTRLERAGARLAGTLLTFA